MGCGDSDGEEWESEGEPTEVVGGSSSESSEAGEEGSEEAGAEAGSCDSEAGGGSVGEGAADEDAAEEDEDNPSAQQLEKQRQANIKALVSGRWALEAGRAGRGGAGRGGAGRHLLKGRTAP